VIPAYRSTTLLHAADPRPCLLPVTTDQSRCLADFGPGRPSFPADAVGGIGVGAKLGLASLHPIVGAAVIFGLRRTALSATERC
jgi:hypothetical protein